jgi:hypothetical protein
MFLIDTIKTIKAANKAKKLIQEHEGIVEGIKAIVAKVQTGIGFLKDNRDEIQDRIDEAESLVAKLKGIIGK